MKTLITVALAGLLLAGCQTAKLKTADTPAAVTKMGVSEMSPAEARPVVEAAYTQFIDVRTPEEFAEGHAYRARNIPLDTLAANLDKLEKNEPVFLICRSGSRSMKAAQILVDNGFPQAISISGGTEAWKAAGLPMGNDPLPSTTGGLDEKTRQALLSALEDERRAQAIYQSVLNKFPGARPFVNIIEAERRHESLLLPLFEKYGIAVPKNEFDAAKTPAPDSIVAACKVGIEAEKVNIALYDDFLKFVKEPDIRQAFEYMRRASKENHLPAFTRCSEGGIGKGPGRGRPF